MFIGKLKQLAIAIWDYILCMLANVFSVDEEEEEQYKDYRYL